VDWLRVFSNRTRADGFLKAPTTKGNNETTYVTIVILRHRLSCSWRWTQGIRSRKSAFLSWQNTFVNNFARAALNIEAGFRKAPGKTYPGATRHRGSE
jgi:hypothetical protein